MKIAILATYTPRVIVELLVFVPVLLLLLLGITSIAISGFFLVRVLVAYFRDKPYHVFQERTGAAIQAGNLGWMAIVCGPLLGLFCALCSSPAVYGEFPFTIFEFARMLLLMTGIGAVAGIIGGGAFWVCSALLRPVRKAVNRMRGVGVWDPDLDGVPFVPGFPAAKPQNKGNR